MALSIINRSNTRGPIVNRTPTEQNDFLLATKKSGDEVKDTFRTSDKFFDESGIKDAANGGLIVQDPETQKVYLAIVPVGFAEFAKVRGTFAKTNEFQHKDAIEMLEKLGSVAKDRQSGYYSAYDLVSAPEKLAELVEAGIENPVGIYELVPTELKGRIVGAKGSKESASETTSEAVEVVSEGSESPVAQEATSAQEEDWEA